MVEPLAACMHTTARPGQAFGTKCGSKSFQAERRWWNAQGERALSNRMKTALGTGGDSALRSGGVVTRWILVFRHQRLVLTRFVILAPDQVRGKLRPGSTATVWKISLLSGVPAPAGMTKLGGHLLMPEHETAASCPSVRGVCGRIDG
jgi:hypothetical protein